MEVDPLASMRCWAIELELGGRTYEVPALTAADWWPVLSSGDLSMILDFVVSDPEDPLNLDDLLLENSLDAGLLGEALTDAIEAASGRSLHASLVLTQVAEMHWASINGALVRRGFRWDSQPLGAALDAIYAEVTGRLAKDELEKFLAFLDNESLTAGKPTERQRAKINEEFTDLAGPRPTTGAKSTGAPSDSARPRTRTRPRPPLPSAP